MTIRKRFDVEHALVMFANNFVLVPAKAIYDKEALAPLMSQISQCHIYLIGILPRVTLVSCSQKDETLVFEMTVAGVDTQLTMPIDAGMELKRDDEYWYLQDKKGDRFAPTEGQIQGLLHEKTGLIDFDVQYIGQAYGTDGSRSALDRLTKHETLQRIALEGVPDTHQLMVMMLSIQQNNQVLTMFNPQAKDMTQGPKRIKAGVDKIFTTSEQEQITLYEASLIRHFEPRFNKEFKHSFPSTNMKVLADCYDKDFTAVVAEISIDDLPCSIKSNKIAASHSVMVKHNLHKDEDRQAFFS